MSHAPKIRIDASAVFTRVQAEGPNALLTRGEAAALVAAKTMRVHDTEESARKRVAMQLDRSAERGQEGVDVFSGGLSRLPNGRVTADELRRWATRKYGPVFDDLPRGAPRDVSLQCSEDVHLGGQLREIFVVPGDPVRKDEMIYRLHAAISELKAAAVAAEVERKRNLAARLNRKR